MANPIVSIIIPTYNHAHFLKAALDSVVAQTVTEWEAIVIDNFSTDGTSEVVNSVADPRIRYEKFANHGVIAASRNHGISLTSAPYIAFLDSDDAWYPEKLARSLAKLHDGNDVVCHAETWIGPNSRRRNVAYGPKERASYENLLFKGNCISTSAVVVKRDLLEKVGGFSEAEAIITAEDYDLWLNLAQEGARIGFVPEILGEYLIHATNQSRSSLRNMNAVIAVFDHHVARLESCPALEAKIRRRRGQIYYGGARSLQAIGRFGDAWPYFFKALRHYPSKPQIYLGLLLNAFRIYR